MSQIDAMPDDVALSFEFAELLLNCSPCYSNLIGDGFWYHRPLAKGKRSQPRQEFMSYIRFHDLFLLSSQPVD